jgi:hypothetical protein
LAKPRARKLKVFQAQLGFYDTVVAAPSKSAALKAWGTHQDLFATGQARLAEDPAAVEAALAHPDTPLKRAVGSKDAFAVEAESLPDVPEAQKRPARADGGKGKADAAPAPRPKPDRRPLDAAEAALRELEAERAREEEDFRRRQDELDAAKAAARAAFASRRKAAVAAVETARRAFRRAGGEG